MLMSSSLLLSANPAASGRFLQAAILCPPVFPFPAFPDMGTVPAGSPVPAGSADVTTCPHQVAHKCLLNREKRMGIDLVSDDVEKELIQVSLDTPPVAELFLPELP